MIRVFAITKDLELASNFAFEDLQHLDLNWYWIDFDRPDDTETKLLESYFNFHPLSIEDAVYSLNRPKLDYYDNYNFLVLNALNQKTLNPEEVSLFVGKDYIVSYHRNSLPEIEEAWERIHTKDENWSKGPTYVAHQILDKIVDRFFPAIYQIEDYLSNLDDMTGLSIHKLIDEVFDIRADLLKLRKIINSMRDLLYRILNSERLDDFKAHRLYFADIHDHLLKLSDMIEASRDMTADMRDSYLSVSSNRMNTNMMILTVITTIFIPLTFIVGLYGMNFDYMPELRWRYGYFGVLFLMAIIASTMFIWFKRKGWFDI